MRYLLFIIILSLSSIVKASEIQFLPVGIEFANEIRASSVVTLDKKELKKLYKQTKYWKRYRTLKTCSFVALGVGVVGTSTCLLWVIGEGFSSNSDDYGGLRNAALATSFVIGASSIPLMVIAYINRHYAVQQVKLSLQPTSFNIDMPNGKRISQPGIGLCLNF